MHFPMSYQKMLTAEKRVQLVFRRMRRSLRLDLKPTDYRSTTHIGLPDIKFRIGLLG